MAEIEFREARTLKVLSQMTEPARPSDIAKVLGDIPLNIGNSVRKLAQSGLAELVDEKGNTWRITDKGRETLADLEGNAETATLLQQAITAQQEPPTKTETLPPPPATPSAEPPARVRYEQSHPTVSCRLDGDTHALLKQRLEDLGGISFADFVKDSLGLLQLKMPDVEEIKDEARGEGYNQAIDDYQIWYYCAVCGKRIDMSPNDNDHKAMIGYMKEHGWGHKSCHGH